MNRKALLTLLSLPLLQPTRYEAPKPAAPIEHAEERTHTQVLTTMAESTEPRPDREEMRAKLKELREDRNTEEVFCETVHTLGRDLSAQGYTFQIIRKDSTEGVVCGLRLGIDETHSVNIFLPSEDQIDRKKPWNVSAEEYTESAGQWILSDNIHVTAGTYSAMQKDLFDWLGVEKMGSESIDDF